jgi:hypothetical protein
VDEGANPGEIQGLFPVKRESFLLVGGITLALLVVNLLNPDIS